MNQSMGLHLDLLSFHKRLEFGNHISSQTLAEQFSQAGQQGPPTQRCSPTRPTAFSREPFPSC